MNSEGTEGERENNQNERPSPDRSSKNSLSRESEGPDSEQSQWDVVTINREVLDETKMDCYHPVPRHTRCPVPQPLRKSITPQGLHVSGGISYSFDCPSLVGCRITS